MGPHFCRDHARLLGCCDEVADNGHYPSDVTLTGIEFSPGMLAIARQRAAELQRKVDLRAGNAHHLEFADASFDTIVCTFSLCAIPDEQRAVSEMCRVLRPGGLLRGTEYPCIVSRF